MAGLSVRRIDVVGPQIHGARLALPSVTTQQFYHDAGITARIQVVNEQGRHGSIRCRMTDFPHTMLGHTLDPKSFEQGHLRPADLAIAQSLLENDPSLAEKLLGRIEWQDTPKIDWDKLPFGLNMCEAMFVARMPRGGNWGAALTKMEDGLYPFSDFPVSPAAQVFHYAQSGFEGQVARRDKHGNIVGFRWMMNAMRLVSTATRTCLTPALAPFYYNASKTSTLANKAIIPPYGTQARFYCREFHVGIGPMMRVAPAGIEMIVVFGSGVGAYFSKDQGYKPIKLRTATRLHRAMPYGTGNVKASANYIMGLVEAIDAKEQGFGEVLWLSLDNQYLNEAGAANIFLCKGNKIYTPKISATEGTVLPGVTRDSIIQLAKDFKYEVVEGDIPLALLFDADEAWCTGTAAVVTPVGLIEHEGNEYTINNFEVGPATLLFYDALSAIQNNDFNNSVLEDIPPARLEYYKTWVDILEAA